MQVEITDERTIELTPEDKLEASILSKGEWSVKSVPPEPFDQRNVTKLELTKTNGDNDS